jgi:hypothetical protein
MGGGLMQLVAYGAQDIYLTGNPQITFFKVVYRRHTNFSMETIQQTLNGTPAASGTSTVTISRNGDLVYKVYVTSTDTAITIGSALCSQVECEIGGQLIDRQYEEWNKIWWELTTPASQWDGFKYMIGDAGAGHTIEDQNLGRLQVPLNFWFCRNPGLALPLIALQYHEVKLKLTWSATQSVATNPEVWIDYIYLDTDERRRFAQVSHEYLIEQIQKQSANTTGNFKLNFNHPVKELIWTSSADYGTALLKLNGHDRFAAQEEEYFQLRQPCDCHTSIPGPNIKHGNMKLLPKSVVLFDGESVTEAGGGTVVDGEFEVDATGGAADNLVSFKLATAAQLTVGQNLAVGDIIKIHYESEAAGASIVSVIATILTIPTAIAAVSTLYTFTLDHNMPDSVVGVGSIIKIGSTDGSDGLGTKNSNTSQLSTFVNVYSFALKPEEHQPSGTCNFSRIDNAQLKITTSTGMTADDNIYAVNYNVLRIMSGMGGLAYSN